MSCGISEVNVESPGADYVAGIEVLHPGIYFPFDGSRTYEAHLAGGGQVSCRFDERRPLAELNHQIVLTYFIYVVTREPELHRKQIFEEDKCRHPDIFPEFYGCVILAGTDFV